MARTKIGALLALHAGLAAMAVTAGVPPVEERRRRFLDNECAATGQTCKMGPYGPGGAIQCEFCGRVAPANPYLSAEYVKERMAYMSETDRKALLEGRFEAIDYGEIEDRIAAFIAGDNTDLTPAERAEVERRVAAMRPEFTMPYGTVTGRLPMFNAAGKEVPTLAEALGFPDRPAGYDTKKRKFKHNRRG